jgi:hypothetical protein
MIFCVKDLAQDLAILLNSCAKLDKLPNFSISPFGIGFYRVIMMTNRDNTWSVINSGQQYSKHCHHTEVCNL